MCAALHAVRPAQPPLDYYRDAQLAERWLTAQRETIGYDPLRVDIAMPDNVPNRAGGQTDIWSLLVYLNDTLHWTREAQAAYLRTQGR